MAKPVSGLSSTHKSVIMLERWSEKGTLRTDILDWFYITLRKVKMETADQTNLVNFTASRRVTT